jgi:hypothetical protein
MKCILEQCPWPASDKKASGCALLGDCGASIALEASRAPCGYEVVAGGNLTIAALKAAGLVTVTSIPDSRHLLVRATRKDSRPVASLEGRVGA